MISYVSYPSIYILGFIYLFFIFPRYLKEDKPHGSAGGLYNFRDLIMEENPVLF